MGVWSMMDPPEQGEPRTAFGGKRSDVAHLTATSTVTNAGGQRSVG